MRSRVHLYDLATSAVQPIGRTEANGRNPMWIGNRLYYLSDHNGTMNLYMHQSGGLKAKALTTFRHFGIRAAAAWGGSIALLRDGRIYIHDIVSGVTEMVDVRVPLDFTRRRRRTVNAARWIESAELIGNGSKIGMVARGDVFELEPESGRARNLTQTTGVAERSAAVSPDGNWLAFFTDRSGEYRLALQPLQGEGQGQEFDIEAAPSFYRLLQWSPDSKMLSFVGKRLDLWTFDLDSSAVHRVDQSQDSGQDRYHHSWSPDGRYHRLSCRALRLFLDRPTRIRRAVRGQERDGATRGG